MFIPALYRYGLQAAKGCVTYHPIGILARQPEVPDASAPPDIVFPFYPGTISPTNTDELSSSENSTPTIVSSSDPVFNSYSSSPITFPASQVPAYDATSAPSVITATVYVFPTDPPFSSSSLSAGAGAGIAIIASVLVAAALVVSFVFWTRRRSRHSKPPPYRRHIDSTMTAFGELPSLLGSLPPEALRTSPYTFRQSPANIVTPVGPQPKHESLPPTPVKEKLAYPPLAVCKGVYMPRPLSLPDRAAETEGSQTDVELNSDADTKSTVLIYAEDEALSPPNESLNGARMRLHPSIAMSTSFVDQLLHTLAQRIDSDAANLSGPEIAHVDERSISVREKQPPLPAVDDPRRGAEDENAHSDLPPRYPASRSQST